MFCLCSCMGVREESVLTWTWAYRSGVASLRLVRAWRRSRGTTRRSSCRVRVGRQRPSRRKPARCMRPWSLPCSSLPTPAPPLNPRPTPHPHPHTHICPLPRADPPSYIYTPTVPQARAMRVWCALYGILDRWRGSGSRRTTGHSRITGRPSAGAPVDACAGPP